MHGAPRGIVPDCRIHSLRKAAVRLARTGPGRVAIPLLLAPFFVCALVGPASAQSFFGKNKVQYERRDWYTLRTPHVEVLFYPEEEPLAREMAAIAESTCVEY